MAATRSNWNGFPSLTSLRAFEAAARLQSFSLAARELSMTDDAVARQVRGLEEHLGRELIFRQGLGMALTWLRSYGLRPDAVNISDIPTEELALSSAWQLYGLHVGAAALLKQDVEIGAQQVVGRVMDYSLACYIVTRPGPNPPELKTFIKWLKAAV